MNKARITYRFDKQGQRKYEGYGEEHGSVPHDEVRQENGKVIPLFEEEFRVVEEERPSSLDRMERIEQEDFERKERLSAPEPMDRFSSYESGQPFIGDYGAWNSPYEAEARRIEELIRNSENRQLREQGERWPEEPREGAYRRDSGSRTQPPAAQEWLYEGYDSSESRSSYREEQRERGYWEGPIVTGPRYVRHSHTPWLKIGGAIAGAAVTGVLLGFLVLTVFSGHGDDAKTPVDGTKPGTVQASATGQAAGDKTALPVSGKVSDQADAGAALTAFTGKQMAISYSSPGYTVLQAGIFSADAGAEQAKTALAQKGLAGVTDLQKDKIYVYAGVTADRDSALALGQKLKEEKLDIYVKTYDLPAVTQVRWNGTAETLSSYLTQSDKLLQTFTKLAALHLEEATPGALEANTLQSITTAHTAWTQIASAAAKEAGEDARPLLQKMNNAMNSAKASFDEYKKNPSTAMLWQAQSYSLQFILGEKQLLERMSAGL